MNNNSKQVELTESYLNQMNIHEYIQIYDYPYCQILRIPCGWIYSFWDNSLQDYARDVVIKENQ